MNIKKLGTIFCLLALNLIPINCCYLVASRIRTETDNIPRAAYEIKDQGSIKLPQNTFTGYIHRDKNEVRIQIKNALKKRKKGALTIHIKGDLNNIKKIYVREEPFRG